ncbi:NACHT and WD40 domain protein [Penicillium waksmanii]|uniref:NACHT and WD40 domain protein n=1 Tax=Penicillium waksmanii TaxID=69791 RepID=UPI00254665C3|nr:NACHT and WD40 domain protein [Penicillium waksmanii]KAJ5984632.1 NACHT and WD40 domain protein [Penicillium waksmanii]
MAQFDRTYLPVLNRLLEGQSKKQERQLVQEFHDIVGTIVALEAPLSAETLSKLIGYSEKQVHQRLSSLHSVLNLPTDNNQPVRLFHLSFRDFLLDSETRDKTPLWVDEARVHRSLTTRCLEICGGLQKNVCGLEWDTRRAELDTGIISSCLSSEMQYACCYWAYHLSQSQNSLVEIGKSSPSTLRFLQQHCLHWMEAMGILGRISQVIGIIDLLQASLTENDGVELAGFLQDARLFVLKFGSLIDEVPLQIYSSGLILSPKESILRKTFENEKPVWIKSSPQCQQSMGCRNSVSRRAFRLAFGPDGCLASASSDEVVRLWDSGTGSLLQSLEGHNDRVHSVAFSVDGNLATGSADGTLKVWDRSSGHLLQTLKGHSDWVNSVAFSFDGLLLASGSDDEYVKLWDTSTGQLRQTIEGHCGRVQTVAFSQHGLLASGSSDEKIMLWDSHTGALKHTLKGHSDWVRSVTFSSDGRLLASGSYDKTVRIWSSSTGVLLRTLQGHSGWVNSVAFSSDDQRLASASKDQTVIIWDSASGDLLRELKGHGGSVLSVGFSSCGQILATASYDKKVRLWDSAMALSQQQDVVGHSDWVYSVSFSPDGRQLASGSRDATVRLWDSSQGVVVRTLHGHSMSVRAVLFSPDGRYLASGSSDKTIRIWDPNTGLEKQVLGGHASRIRSIAVSPNSRLLASMSNDEMLILWDPVMADIKGGSIKFSLEPFQNSSYQGVDLSDSNIRLWFKTHSSIWPRRKDPIWIENDQWVTSGGNRKLWLSPEYRRSCSTVQGHTIALGHASGRVLFIKFEDSSHCLRK